MSSRKSFMSRYDSESEEEKEKLLKEMPIENNDAVTCRNCSAPNKLSFNEKHPPESNYETRLNYSISPQNGEYEEFFKGSVPCPTCRGSGRIPKEEEKKLVAIIPLTDARLKPRRTFIYIIVTIILCVVTGSLLLFFLLPRNVVASSDKTILIPTRRYVSVASAFTNLTVVNCYNFTNHNFFPITIDKVVVQSWLKNDLTQIGKGFNRTRISVPARSYQQYCVDVVLVFYGYYGYIAEFCLSQYEYMNHLFVVFKLTANYSVLNQDLQTTISAPQYVDCSNHTHTTPKTTSFVLPTIKHSLFKL